MSSIDVSISPMEQAYRYNSRDGVTIVKFLVIEGAPVRTSDFEFAYDRQRSVALCRKVRMLHAWALDELKVRTGAEARRLREAAAVWGQLDAEQVQREAHLPSSDRDFNQLERETAAVWGNLHAGLLSTR